MCAERGHSKTLGLAVSESMCPLAVAGHRWVNRRVAGMRRGRAGRQRLSAFGGIGPAGPAGAPSPGRDTRVGLSPEMTQVDAFPVDRLVGQKRDRVWDVRMGVDRFEEQTHPAFRRDLQQVDSEPRRR